jgi:hypothetical protein
MPCGWYKLADGTVVHINTSRRDSLPKKCVHCHGFASKLCDHKVADKDAGWPSDTCDAPICERCALHIPGKNLDYCKHHAQQHQGEVPAALPFEEGAHP